MPRDYPMLEGVVRASCRCFVRDGTVAARGIGLILIAIDVAIAMAGYRSERIGAVSRREMSVQNALSCITFSS